MSTTNEFTRRVSTTRASRERFRGARTRGTLQARRGAHPRFRSWVLLVALALIGSVATAGQLRAAIIHVPATVPTIQGAIDAAVDGDTIIVSPGTYFENIDYGGKAITVRSEIFPPTSNSATDTVIDGGQNGPVVKFVSGEGPDSVLQGVIVQNGAVVQGSGDPGGGGILCIGSSPSIVVAMIRQNTSAGDGGGALFIDSSSTLLGCFILNNTAGNATSGRGGGVRVIGGSVQFLLSRIVQNDAGAEGGAIDLENTVGTVIESCGFVNNAAGVGGGIAIRGSSTVTLRDVLAADNSANGILLPGNTILGSGGAISVEDSATATIVNATLVGNAAAGGNGGGVHIDPFGTATVTMRNSIVRANVAASNAQIDPFVIVTYSNVEGGAPGIGNQSADPLLTSPVGVTLPIAQGYLSHLAAGQAQNSPCIDAGDPSDSISPHGTTRTDSVVDTGTIDLGAHYPLPSAFGLLRRGDCNGDTGQDISDAIFLLAVLFPPMGGDPAEMGCVDACDANDDGGINLADAITILGALFGSPAIPLPTPSDHCGFDGTPDSLGCETQQCFE